MALIVQVADAWTAGQDRSELARRTRSTTVAATTTTTAARRYDAADADDAGSVAVETHPGDSRRSATSLQ